MKSRLVGMSAVLAIATACGDGTGPGPGPGPGPNPITLAITPPAVGLLAGGTIQLTAAASDGSSPAITWTSSNTNVATVSASGVVTAVATGNSTITAAAGTANTTMSVGVVASATLSGDVQPILSANCALSGCHAGASPAQGQDLSAGNTFTNVVNVPALELASMARVEPGDQTLSYLVHKIRGTQASVGGTGQQMPRGAGPLSLNDQDIISAWVQAGAQNN